MGHLVGVRGDAPQVLLRERECIELLLELGYKGARLLQRDSLDKFLRLLRHFEKKHERLGHRPRLASVESLA